QINGELIAKAVSGESAEFESGNIFSGTLGTNTSLSNLATPEPSTWVLLLTAIAGLSLFQKRRATLKMYTK
ncbi:MAG TPA: PEP-CTERM sorting domain-containing protein, partial [Bryobacteraceae bacterium]|nr:PEP-CTERM sorting domain-containing protein [Bryobacteraceae bacterium]